MELAPRKFCPCGFLWCMRLEGTWRNMAWFARMGHQSQEVLRAATVGPRRPGLGAEFFFICHNCHFHTIYEGPPPPEGGWRPYTHTPLRAVTTLPCRFRPL